MPRPGVPNGLDALAARLGVTASSSAAEIDQALANERVRSYLAARLHLDPHATGDDILAAVDDLKARASANQAARAAAEEARQRASASRALSSTPPLPSAPTRGPAWARNPLVDKVRAAGGGATATAPTLFASGDLPAVTASGISPQTLLEVPWQARHAMAAAPTAAAAYEILETCSGNDGDTAAEMFYGSHVGNQEYQQRVTAWEMSGLTDAALHAAGTSEAAQEMERREAERVEAFNRTLRGE